MSLKPSATSKRPLHQPAWLHELLGIGLPGEGERFHVGEATFVMQNGIPRAEGLLTDSQLQTRDAFSFIWSGTDRFRQNSFKLLADWFKAHYGDVADAAWWRDYGPRPLLLDAGCGIGHSAFGLFEGRLRQVRYLGVDVSTAVEAARERFAQEGVDAAFLQASLMDLPIPDASVDVVYAQGVLHHTDSTEAALHALARKLKPGGRILFYVYRRKGPIREFTDDCVRGKLQGMSPEQAWAAMLPLTKLGKLLGDMKIEIKVPEPIALLEIPAGKMDLQRFFYWHVLKAFHHPDLSLDELNHINLDWHAPANAHRQTPEQVRAWCQAAGLTIEREHLQESGITVIACKGDR
jgi:SAM-dependent methyltransferase